MVFVLCTDVITMHSRISIFGANGALASRYITVSTLYAIAIIVLLIQTRIDKFSIFLVAFIIVPFVIAGYVNNIASSNSHARYFSDIKQCLNQPNPKYNCRLEAYPDAKKVTGWVDFLKTKHIGGF